MVLYVALALALHMCAFISGSYILCYIHNIKLVITSTYLYVMLPFLTATMPTNNVNYREG